MSFTNTLKNLKTFSNKEAIIKSRNVVVTQSPNMLRLSEIFEDMRMDEECVIQPIPEPIISPRSTQKIDEIKKRRLEIELKNFKTIESDKPTRPEGVKPLKPPKPKILKAEIAKKQQKN